MFSIDYQVTTSTCGPDGRLKLFSALQMMQDCSELWSYSEPVFRKWLDTHHMAQLLASRQVEVVRVPSFRERLRVTTSVYDCKPLFGFRNTFIYGEDGKPCYRSWSMGAFVNMKTGRLSPLGQEVLDSYHRDEKLDMDYHERRIIVPQAGLTTHPAVEIMRNDIDYNRHMNNANYVRIGMELLPDGFDVHGLRIEFKAPSKLGDVLIPTTIQTPDAFYVALSLGSKQSTILEFT